MRNITAIHVTLGLFLGMAIFIGAASAKPLTPDDCRARLAEHKDLVSKGAGTLAEKEPDWVKANMTEDDMKRVKRLLEVEDEIRFRCPDIDVAGVTPGQLLGKKQDDSDEAQGDKDADTDSADKAGKQKPVKDLSGPDIPLPLRKPALPKRADNLSFGNFGQFGQH